MMGAKLPNGNNNQLVNNNRNIHKVFNQHYSFVENRA